MIISKPVGNYKSVAVPETWHPIYCPPTYTKIPFYACQTKVINGKNTTQILVEYIGDLVWINVDSSGCGNKNDLLEVDV